MIACMLLAGILEGVVAKSSASLEDALARETQPSNDKEDGAGYEADEEERA